MDAKERRLHDAKLGSALDNAKSSLPLYWNLIIAVEQGQHCVSLVNPEGEPVDVESSDSLADEINTAINKARRLELGESS